MKIHVEDWCLFLPGSSTLRSKLPYVDPYRGIPEGSVEILAKHAIEGCRANSFGLVSDEMEIRKGLVYRKSDGRIIGLVRGEFPECQVNELSKESIPEKLVTHVMQVFLVSTDSNITIPLGYYPTKSVTGEWLSEKFQSLISSFSKCGAEIHWTSTDGFAQSKEFRENMMKWSKEQNRTYYHIYDYVHVLKNIRNMLLNRVIQSQSSKEGFSIKTLDKFYNDSKYEFSSKERVDELRYNTLL